MKFHICVCSLILVGASLAAQTPYLLENDDFTVSFPSKPEYAASTQETPNGQIDVSAYSASGGFTIYLFKDPKSRLDFFKDEFDNIQNELAGMLLCSFGDDTECKMITKNGIRGKYIAITHYDSTGVIPASAVIAEVYMRKGKLYVFMVMREESVSLDHSGVKEFFDSIKFK